MNLTEDQKKEIILFLELNRYTKSYYNSIKLPKGDFCPYTDRPALQFKDQDKHIIKKAIEDIKEIKEAEKAYHNRPGFKVGEVIELPNGKSTHITHVWKEAGQLQTG